MKPDARLGEAPLVHYVLLSKAERYALRATARLHSASIASLIVQAATHSPVRFDSSGPRLSYISFSRAYAIITVSFVGNIFMTPQSHRNTQSGQFDSTLAAPVRTMFPFPATITLASHRWQSLATPIKIQMRVGSMSKGLRSRCPYFVSGRPQSQKVTFGNSC